MAQWANTFLDNVPILNPLKIQGNHMFSGIFKDYKIRNLAKHGLSCCTQNQKVAESNPICCSAKLNSFMTEVFIIIENIPLI